MDNIEMDALKENLKEHYYQAYQWLNDDIKENSNRHHAAVLHEMIDMKNKYKKIMNKTSENMWKAAMLIVNLENEKQKLREEIKQRDVMLLELVKYTDTLSIFVDVHSEILQNCEGLIAAHQGIIFSKKEGQDNPNFKGMTDDMLRQLWEVCEGNINKIKKELKNVYGLSYSWQAIDKRARSIGLK